jgi:branched-chain amino acid transport system substrate-binding protein
MKKRLFITLIILICCFSIVLNVAAQDQLKIGCLFPFTGDLARLGNDSYRGAELARIEKNENGGLFGKEIVFVRGDAVTPKQAVTEAERLINRENVDIILGTYSSSLSYVASEVAEKYGKIYWELGAIATNLTERGFEYYFRSCPRSSQYAKYATDVAVDQLLPRIGIEPEDAKIAGIFEDSLMGTEAADGVKIALEEKGLSLTMQDFYSSTSVDLTPLIMRLRQINPDVILASQYLTDALLFQRQSKEMNLYVPIFIGLGGGVSLGEFRQALGNDAVGILETSFVPMVQNVNPEYAPGSQNVIKSYEEVFGEKMTSSYPVINYAGTMTLWEVLEKAGSTDPEKVREAALEIDIPDRTTPIGYGFKYDETGQNIRARVVMLQWKEDSDTMYTVWPTDAAVPGSEIDIPLLTWQEKAKLGQ